MSNVSFHGIGRESVTFAGGLLTEGHVVTMAGNGTVKACAKGDALIGVALCCRDDACSVQVDGFVTVSYTGTAPAVGFSTLSANGSGGIAADASGKTYLVVDVDTARQTATIKL